MRGRAEQLVVLYIFGRRRSMDVGDGVNKIIFQLENFVYLFYECNLFRSF